MANPYRFEDVATELDRGEYFANFVGSPFYEDAVYERFSDAEIERRLGLTREKMARLQLDAVIACGGPSHWSFGGGVFWLSNHREWHAVSVYLLVPSEGEPTLVYGMGGTHIEAVRRAVTVRDVRPAARGRFAQVLAERVRELGLGRGRIGITVLDPRNEDYLPVNQYETLRQELPDAEFVWAGDFFHEFLVRKSEEELARVRRAGQLATAALRAMAAAARPGITEYELKAAAAHAILAGGGEVDFIIVGSTPMASPRMVFGNPRPSGRRLQRGDLILNEIAAGYEGYTAQIGVPISVGRPTDEVRRMFDEIVRPGFEYLAEALRPGVPFEELVRRGRFFRERGYQCRPILLHGIDLVSHAPEVYVDRVHCDPEDAVMQPGMVLMLEPNPISPDGMLGLFFGHTFILTETSSERITGDAGLDLLVADG